MELTVLERKYDRLFDFLDINEDGEITPDDFIELGQRMLSDFGHSIATRKGAQYVNSYSSMWRLLLDTADSNDDGAISRADFQAAMATVVGTDPERFDAVIRPMVVANFQLADADDNGTVDRAEFRVFQQALGVGPEEADIAFELMDVDGDGLMTEDEVVAAVSQFYTSDDPSSPGNAFFGGF